VLAAVVCDMSSRFSPLHEPLNVARGRRVARPGRRSCRSRCGARILFIACATLTAIAAVINVRHSGLCWIYHSSGGDPPGVSHIGPSSSRARRRWCPRGTIVVLADLLARDVASPRQLPVDSIMRWLVSPLHHRFCLDARCWWTRDLAVIMVGDICHPIAARCSWRRYRAASAFEISFSASSPKSRLLCESDTPRTTGRLTA